MAKKSAAYDKYREETYANKMQAGKNWKQLSFVLAGPTMVIETIIREASVESGIDMDWCFQGGRAFVLADVNSAVAEEKAVKAIESKLPQANRL